MVWGFIGIIPSWMLRRIRAGDQSKRMTMVCIYLSKC